MIVTLRLDGVAILKIDNPPVNVLSSDVSAALLDALAAAEADPGVVSIVVMGAGRTFVAGADIRSLEQAALGRLDAAIDMHEALARIENCTKPVVMAIHGTALGGGLELAMAGRYRVCAPDARHGQPEVNLGVIPGAEGTQRLPRLVGIAAALDLCLTGQPIDARRALAIGLVDRVVEGDLMTGAADFARQAAAARHPAKKRDRRDRLGGAAENAPLFAAARARADAMRRGVPAPVAAVEAIEAAATLPFDEGRRKERELFFRCVQSDQARSMIRAFFERRKKRPENDPGGRFRVRPVRIVDAGVHVDRRADGATYVRAAAALGAYPATISARLEQWAHEAPDRPFLAERAAEGHWHTTTYGEMYERVRGVAQWLLTRGLSADRPVTILSGNSIDHACLALAAMHVGIPYAPVSPAYSLLSRDHKGLARIFGIFRPALVYAQDGGAFEPALRAVVGPETEVVVSSRGERRATVFEELAATPATAAVDRAHAGVTADTIAKVLFTSGSTGRPKGVINTQRMLCANQEMIRSRLAFLGDQPPVFCDWLPWNHTFGGNHNFGCTL